MIFTEGIVDVFPVAPAIRNSECSDTLAIREAIVGNKTLPARTILTLANVLREQHISWEIVTHAATESARETQAVLPHNVTVMKTVTVRAGAAIFLYSSLGDVHINKHVMRSVTKFYRLSSKETHKMQINPPEIDPESAYNMSIGMVSPFLSTHHTIVRAIICSYDSCEYVAISLSLWESLVISYDHIHSLLRHFAKIQEATFPHLIFVE